MNYVRGNKFLHRINIADAAVDWQCVPESKFSEITINEEGMPVLEGCPDLTERAEALFIAAQSGDITGLVTNEDGYPLPAHRMMLDRASVAKFCNRTEQLIQLTAINTPPRETNSEGSGRFYSVNETFKQLDVSRATFYRLRKEGAFPGPDRVNPDEWHETTITRYLTERALERARAPQQPLDDI